MTAFTAKLDNAKTLDEIKECVALYYDANETLVGGSLHIVLDDYNYEGYHVAWCREHAQSVGDLDGVKIAEALLDLSIEDRATVCSLHSGLCVCGHAMTLHEWSLNVEVEHVGAVIGQGYCQSRFCDCVDAQAQPQAKEAGK